MLFKPASLFASLFVNVIGEKLITQTQGDEFDSPLCGLSTDISWAGGMHSFPGTIIREEGSLIIEEDPRFISIKCEWLLIEEFTVSHLASELYLRSNSYSEISLACQEAFESTGTCHRNITYLAQSQQVIQDTTFRCSCDVPYLPVSGVFQINGLISLVSPTVSISSQCERVLILSNVEAQSVFDMIEFENVSVFQNRFPLGDSLSGYIYGYRSFVRFERGEHGSHFTPNTLIPGSVSFGCLYETTGGQNIIEPSMGDLGEIDTVLGAFSGAVAVDSGNRRFFDCPLPGNFTVDFFNDTVTPLLLFSCDVLRVFGLSRNGCPTDVAYPNQCSSSFGCRYFVLNPRKIFKIQLHVVKADSANLSEFAFGDPEGIIMGYGSVALKGNFSSFVGLTTKGYNQNLQNTHNVHCFFLSREELAFSSTSLTSLNDTYAECNTPSFLFSLPLNSTAAYHCSQEPLDEVCLSSVPQIANISGLRTVTVGVVITGYPILHDMETHLSDTTTSNYWRIISILYGSPPFSIPSSILSLPLDIIFLPPTREHGIEVQREFHSYPPFTVAGNSILHALPFIHYSSPGAALNLMVNDSVQNGPLKMRITHISPIRDLDIVGCVFQSPDDFEHSNYTLNTTSFLSVDKGAVECQLPNFFDVKNDKTINTLYDFLVGYRVNVPSYMSENMTQSSDDYHETIIYPFGPVGMSHISSGHISSTKETAETFLPLTSIRPPYMQNITLRLRSSMSIESVSTPSILVAGEPLELFSGLVIRAHLVDLPDSEEPNRLLLFAARMLHVAPGDVNCGIRIPYDGDIDGVISSVDIILHGYLLKAEPESSVDFDPEQIFRDPLLTPTFTHTCVIATNLQSIMSKNVSTPLLAEFGVKSVKVIDSNTSTGIDYWVFHDEKIRIEHSHLSDGFPFQPRRLFFENLNMVSSLLGWVCRIDGILGIEECTTILSYDTLSGGILQSGEPSIGTDFLLRGYLSIVGRVSHTGDCEPFGSEISYPVVVSTISSFVSEICSLSVATIFDSLRIWKMETGEIETYDEDPSGLIQLIRTLQEIDSEIGIVFAKPLYILTIRDTFHMGPSSVIFDFLENSGSSRILSLYTGETQMTNVLSPYDNGLGNSNVRYLYLKDTNGDDSGVYSSELPPLVMERPECCVDRFSSTREIYDDSSIIRGIFSLDPNWGSYLPLAGIQEHSICHIIHRMEYREMAYQTMGKFFDARTLIKTRILCHYEGREGHEEGVLINSSSIHCPSFSESISTSIEVLLQSTSSISEKYTCEPRIKLVRIQNVDVNPNHVLRIPSLFSLNDNGEYIHWFLASDHIPPLVLPFYAEKGHHLNNPNNSDWYTNDYRFVYDTLVSSYRPDIHEWSFALNETIHSSSIPQVSSLSSISVSGINPGWGYTDDIIDVFLVGKFAGLKRYAETVIGVTSILTQSGVSHKNYFNQSQDTGDIILQYADTPIGDWADHTINRPQGLLFNETVLNIHSIQLPSNPGRYSFDLGLTYTVINASLSNNTGSNSVYNIETLITPIGEIVVSPKLTIMSVEPLFWGGLLNISLTVDCLFNSDDITADVYNMFSTSIDRLRDTDINGKENRYVATKHNAGCHKEIRNIYECVYKTSIIHRSPAVIVTSCDSYFTNPSTHSKNIKIHCNLTSEIGELFSVPVDHSDGIPYLCISVEPRVTTRYFQDTMNYSFVPSQTICSDDSPHSLHPHALRLPFYAHTAFLDLSSDHATITGGKELVVTLVGVPGIHNIIDLIEDPVCRFNNHKTTAVVLTPNGDIDIRDSLSISCITPKVTSIDDDYMDTLYYEHQVKLTGDILEIPFSISIDGVHFIDRKSIHKLSDAGNNNPYLRHLKATFKFHNDALLGVIKPEFGPFTGGTAINLNIWTTYDVPNICFSHILVPLFEITDRESFPRAPESTPPSKGIRRLYRTMTPSISHLYTGSSIPEMKNISVPVFIPRFTSKGPRCVLEIPSPTEAKKFSYVPRWTLLGVNVVNPVFGFNRQYLEPPMKRVSPVTNHVRRTIFDRVYKKSRLVLNILTDFYFKGSGFIGSTHAVCMATLSEATANVGTETPSIRQCHLESALIVHSPMSASCSLLFPEMGKLCSDSTQTVSTIEQPESRHAISFTLSMNGVDFVGFETSFLKDDTIHTGIISLSDIYSPLISRVYPGVVAVGGYISIMNIFLERGDGIGLVSCVYHIRIPNEPTHVNNTVLYSPDTSDVCNTEHGYSSFFAPYSSHYTIKTRAKIDPDYRSVECNTPLLPGFSFQSLLVDDSMSEKDCSLLDSFFVGINLVSESGYETNNVLLPLIISPELSWVTVTTLTEYIYKRDLRISFTASISIGEVKGVDSLWSMRSNGEFYSYLRCSIFAGTFDNENIDTLPIISSFGWLDTRQLPRRITGRHNVNSVFCDVTLLGAPAVHPDFYLEISFETFDVELDLAHVEEFQHTRNFPERQSNITGEPNSSSLSSTLSHIPMSQIVLWRKGLTITSQVFIENYYPKEGYKSGGGFIRVRLSGSSEEILMPVSSSTPNSVNHDTGSSSSLLPPNSEIIPSNFSLGINTGAQAVSCFFGDVETESHVVGSLDIICRIPNADVLGASIQNIGETERQIDIPFQVPVSVFLRDFGSKTPEVQFNYIDYPVALFVYPAFSSFYGNILITISGHGFRPSDSCFFRLHTENPVPGNVVSEVIREFVDSKAITCRAPTIHSFAEFLIGSYSNTVENLESEYEPTSTTKIIELDVCVSQSSEFCYWGPSIFAFDQTPFEIFPRSGHISGFSAVSIISSYNQDTRNSLSDLSTPQTRICRDIHGVPEDDRTICDISAIPDSATTDETIIIPIHTSISTTSWCSNWKQIPRCIFGDKAVKAFCVDNSFLCLSPPYDANPGSQEPVIVPFRFSLNGVEEYPIKGSDEITFAYYLTAVIDNISPQTLQILRGTIWQPAFINILGRNLHYSDSFFVSLTPLCGDRGSMDSIRKVIFRNSEAGGIIFQTAQHITVFLPHSLHIGVRFVVDVGHTYDIPIFGTSEFTYEIESTRFPVRGIRHAHIHSFDGATTVEQACYNLDLTRSSEERWANIIRMFSPIFLEDFDDPNSHLDQEGCVYIKGKVSIEMHPKGNYCSGTPSLSEIPCSPGYFQHLEGSLNCKPCPIGHYCPASGLMNPFKCPEGYICNRKGLVSPRERCPMGFYCSIGVSYDGAYTPSFGIQEISLISKFTDLVNESIDIIDRMDEDKINPEKHNLLSVLGFPVPCSKGGWCPEGTIDGSSFIPCHGQALSITASQSIFGLGVCPPGYTCDNPKLPRQECPAGTYCGPYPGQQIQMECPVGYFNPSAGQICCLPCPEGFICPIPGLLEPVQSECGYVSLKKGGTRHSAAHLCPTGMKCSDSIGMNVVHHICEESSPGGHMGVRCEDGLDFRGGGISSIYGISTSFEEIVSRARSSLRENQINQKEIPFSLKFTERLTELIDSANQGSGICCWNRGEVRAFLIRVTLKWIEEFDTSATRAEKLLWRILEELEHAILYTGIELLIDTVNTSFQTTTPPEYHLGIIKDASDVTVTDDTTLFDWSIRMISRDSHFYRFLVSEIEGHLLLNKPSLCQAGSFCYAGTCDLLESVTSDEGAS